MKTVNTNNAIKKSIFDVNKIIVLGIRANTIVRVSYDTKKKGEAIPFSFKDETYSNHALGLSILALTINQLVAAKESSATIVAPTDCVIRMLQIRKIVNENPETITLDALIDDPDLVMDALIDEIVSKWTNMPDDENLLESLRDVCLAYLDMKSKGYHYNFVKRHTLTKWQLNRDLCEKAGIQEGDILSFKDGKDIKYGINSTDASYLNGDFKVSVQELFSSDGRSFNNYFIPRKGLNMHLLRARKLNDKVEELLPSIEVEDISLGKETKALA